jgi:hypothetical protein
MYAQNYAEMDFTPNRCYTSVKQLLRTGGKKVSRGREQKRNEEEVSPMNETEVSLKSYSKTV